MYLRESKHLLQLWQYSLNEGANVVIMRHGPKASDDTSGLSKEGKKLTREYGDILNSCNSLKNEFWIKMALFATSKSRTVDTLELLFPESYYINYFIQTSLDTVAVTEETQRICNDFHAKVGHWRGYSVSQSYFYLQKYSGTDYGNLHSEVLHRMSNGIRELFNRYEDRLVIYCGHSPQAEMAVAEVTGLDISELGWFLNPLSSVHLRMKDGKVEFVSRINPIIGYVDLESETFFRS